MKTSREQKPYTVFSSIGFMLVYSVTALGAAIRYHKKTGYKPDGVLKGHMIH